MFKNYMIIAWRHLLQHKGFSFINVFGLAIGMSFAVLIGLWIQYETSFDQFHMNKDRIAMVLKNTFFNKERNTQQLTPMPLYYELKNNFPEVVAASRLRGGDNVALSVGETSVSKTVQFVDPDFLKMFSFELTRGNPGTALNDINSVVITESTARSLFGQENPLGKHIRVDNDHNVSVSAVVKDVPTNSTIQFDFLAPFEYLVAHDDWIKSQRNDWGNNFHLNLLQLKEGISMDAFSKKIESLNTDRDKTVMDLYLFLLPLKDWHLRSEYKNWVKTDGKYAYVKLFALIGFFVLLIACINFMNLSTARSEKRAREVGIRKAIGSLRSQLIAQFLTETLLTTMIAFCLTMLIVPLVLPLLKDIGFENIRFDATNINLLLAVFGAAIVTGLIAGSYPALYLSSFLPVKVLKGMFVQGKAAVAFRKVLVISQFAISIGLIISTAIVFQQIKFARTRPLGYNTNNLIRISSNSEMAKNFEPLKAELLKTNYVQAVARTSGPLTTFFNSWGDFSWEGKDPNAQIVLDVMMTEWDFEKAAGIEFVQGRPFSRAYKTDSSGVILNEAALNVIGYKDPIGKSMKSGNRDLHIVGVVKNMIIRDPFKAPGPMVILFNPGASNNFVFLRLKKNISPQTALPSIQSTVEKYSPSFPFDYHFSDQDYEDKFQLEKQVGKLAGIFAGFGVLISCLGLFGLAAFMAERRIKEIGIRKVLGASAARLWLLLSSEFVYLVMIGSVIASVVAYKLMSNWLQQYDYRIDIQWWVFLSAGAGALLIALLTVSVQAVKAVVSNPIHSLRSE